MSSPEKFCLGDLMKDIDKELNNEDFGPDFSKDETTYKSSQEQNLLSKESFFSSNLTVPLFSPAIDTYGLNTHNISEIFSKNNIFLSLKNKNSTKQLQKYLQEATEEQINQIIKELNNFFPILMKNKNGNYFCSDLFKVCNKEQRIKILKEITNKISEDCFDEFGTHPIQTLIELSYSEEEYKLLLNSFSNIDKILMASLNHNGSFVIQKLIVHIPESYRNDFNNNFIKLICVLSRDMYGVCTVKKFIAYTNNELFVKQILNIILANFISISDNQYGNYLIQYLLEKWWKTEEGKYLKKMLISKFSILYKNQFSYHICDLYLNLCTDEEKKIALSIINNSNNQIPYYFNKFESNKKNDFKYKKNFNNNNNLNK